MKHNFNAGPSALCEEALKKSAEAVINYNNTGMSLLCMSHRSKEFEAIVNDTVKTIQELLQIPQGYQVLFLQGGASQQFAMVPMNILVNKAGYVISGVWSEKAIKEAKLFGEVVEIATTKKDNFSCLPKDWEKNVGSDLNYLHYTTNNTIFGTQFKADPLVPVPLVADMSSDIFSRPIDIKKYDLIYAGAQKNIGPSGLTLVIIKEEILGKISKKLPAMLDYRVHIENNSLYNTPPTLAIYTSLQQLKWYQSLGGIESIQKINAEKANLLYNEIDANKLFKGTVTCIADRSVMNVTFVMNEEYKELEDEFLKFAKSQDHEGLKGHRSVGGFRASIYNAVSVQDVKALVKTMQEFAQKH